MKSHGSLTNTIRFSCGPPPGGLVKAKIVASAIAAQCCGVHTHHLSFFGKPKQAESEDSMGARRMPWRRKPKKGAASRDSPGGGANGLRSPGARMGEPGGGHAPPPRAEYIGSEEATRGTETSKYPEEEKSTEIALVAASERARRPNRHVRYSFRALACRGCGGRRPGA